MYDAFSKVAVTNATGRRRRAPKPFGISASYGVRHGYISDPNWPPAQLPEKGPATARRALRIPCKLLIRTGNTSFKSQGDISTGGVKFTLNAPITAAEVEVAPTGSQLPGARARILGFVKEGNHYVFRAQFVAPVSMAFCGEVVHSK